MSECRRSGRVIRGLTLGVMLSLAVGLLGGCNVWRLAFPSHQHEAVPPSLPAKLGTPAILVFSKTNGYRHGEAIPAGLAMFEKIADRRGWSLVRTENGAVFDERLLSRFDVTVWHNSSGDTLSPKQRAALKSWIESGGGFVGIHGAGGDPSYDWEWYVEELIGAQFIGHTLGPQFQEARVVVEDREHPGTRGLDETFFHVEEWYSFDRNPRDRPGYRVLMSVDESTYSPRLRLFFTDRDLSMGDHPVVWTHCVGRGRVFFSALGHQAAAYEKAEIVGLLEGAVAWAARVEGRGCDG
ncbi:ThuA domain-containing protein [Myxococcota bacterium]|nr:ThuA domain-containing protein [Myxococcota bacterium]